MRETRINTGLRRLHYAAATIACGLVITAQAAVPGISGPTFKLQAAEGYISQPDGTNVYTWGYGCDGTPSGFLPTAMSSSGSCNSMQQPGPTLIVNAGQTVSVTLRNNLPKAAGNTSLLFPGFDDVTATVPGGETVPCSVAATGILTTEAANTCAVTYTFTASRPGTYTYYSGTQGDLQIEMGLYGALIVLPNLTGGLPSGYTTRPAGTAQNPTLPNTCVALNGARAGGGVDYRLAAAAYDHPSACYDREYLFQLSSMDLEIHRQAEQQKDLACTQPTGCMVVATEPYTPSYFMVNGRSFPDVTDPHYAVQYPNQPYNGNPHMHPGELVLLRVIGTNRWQHTLHEHGNHVRVLARDGNMLLSAGGKLAGPLLFTTTSTPGLAMDGVYQWTAKGLNWDVYGHSDTAGSGNVYSTDPKNPYYNVSVVCQPDANGYYTTGSGAPLTAPNYYEWCADHKKALESRPFGRVGSGGPVTLPDPTIFAMGPWYGGSPYLGQDATARAVGVTPIPPSGTVANTSGSFAFMWHSHNEREITTNNAFPGGMMMMMLVDPWDVVVNESN